jgi:hypothetical protein
MRKNIILLLILLLTFINIIAQNHKTTIGLIPFSSTVPKNKVITIEIQEIVLEALNTKSNIITIDRSKDALLNKELDLQINEKSMASKKLVEQGKKMGADHLIIGTTVSYETIREKGSSSGLGGLFTDKNTFYNKSTIVFSLQILDVETGKIINQKIFNQTNENKSILGNDDTKDEAKAKAILSLKKNILLWLNEVYPIPIKILKIEDRTKSGKPKTILLTGVDNSFNIGKKLILEETELIQVENGKEPLRRTKKIASLTISEKQGDITVCKITDGEDIIEDKINKGNLLSIKQN